jgi:hypothetical protein
MERKSVNNIDYDFELIVKVSLRTHEFKGKE